MELIFEKVNDNAIIPKYAHDTDSGMDAYSNIASRILPGGFGKIPLGIRIHIPNGYELQLRPRSGLSSKGIIGAFGTIDCDYRGEVSAILYNFTDTICAIELGDRVCQLVLAPVYHAEIREGKVDTNTDRGTGGFGSTGV